MSHDVVEVFFDTEFTHFQDNDVNQVIKERNPDYQPAKSQLISIGFASECGKTFYAESTDFEYGLCSQFVVDHVLPLLEGGAARMSLADMAKQIKDFIDSFDRPVTLISDAPDFDWPFLESMFKNQGFPQNLNLTNAPSIGSPLLEKILKEMGKPIQNELKQVGASTIVFKDMKQQAMFISSLKAQHSALGFRHHHALDDAVANMQAYADSSQQ